MENSNGLHVVLGASGGLGNAVVRELVKQEKIVRAANRSGKIDAPSNVEVIKADTLNPESTLQACKGASVIFHCVNVPYPEWREKLPVITTNIIEAAASSNAKLVFGDNLYMYGFVSGPIKEGLPYTASGPKGNIRIQIANQIDEAHQSGKIKAVTGRAPDYYGPQAENAAMGTRVFVPALKGKVSTVLGNIDKKHTYIFVDDFARGLIILSEAEKALGKTWHIPSAETLTTRRFLNMVYDTVGHQLKVRAASKKLVSIMGIFNPLMRELKEMMYQWENDYVVDHSKFMEAFDFNTTPHKEGIQTTLDWYKRKYNL
jgi:nucleoside-diphosphate-sugar epimerase